MAADGRHSLPCALLIRPPEVKHRQRAPYIERSDGTLVADSHVIIDELTCIHNITLDEPLDDRQRALAVVLTRTVEDHLYWALVWERWSQHWPATRDAFFGAMPALLRPLVTPMIRRSVLKALRGQGLGLMEPQQIHHRAEQDLHALATILADNEFFLGPPSSVDATAYGLLANIALTPVSDRLQ